MLISNSVLHSGCPYRHQREIEAERERERERERESADQTERGERGQVSIMGALKALIGIPILYCFINIKVYPLKKYTM